VLPPDLDAGYAGLPQAGFGRLAVAEAALVANAPVARVAKDGGPRLVLAAPARAGDRLVGIAYVRLPLSLATDAIQAANVDGSSYLALREGNYTILARGDQSLSNAAEALAAKVPNTDLRVVAGLPDAEMGLFRPGRDRVAGGGAVAARCGCGGMAGIAPRSRVPDVRRARRAHRTDLGTGGPAGALADTAGTCGRSQGTTTGSGGPRSRRHRSRPSSAPTTSAASSGKTLDATSPS
jgi:hypothetical protein